jgi:pre-mRNA-splicing helicase BRR2
MLRNPRHYSIPSEEVEEDPQLLRRRVNLAHTAFSILERNGLINYDRRNGAVTPNFLGKVASFYYIKNASMAIYNANLKNNCGLIELIKIFAMSI